MCLSTIVSGRYRMQWSMPFKCPTYLSRLLSIYLPSPCCGATLARTSISWLERSWSLGTNHANICGGIDSSSYGVPWLQCTSSITAHVFALSHLLHPCTCQSWLFVLGDCIGLVGKPVGHYLRILCGGMETRCSSPSWEEHPLHSQHVTDYNVKWYCIMCCKHFKT